MAKAKQKASKKVQRRKPKAKAKPRAKARTKPRPKHKFTVSYHREQDFDQGLRSYAKYRDLGIAPATGGMVQAHVIRFIPPFKPEDVSTPHYHDVEFQMIYVLKGWIKKQFRGRRRAHVQRRLLLDSAAEDQARRGRLFRRLRIARDRAAGRFRNGDAGLNEPHQQ